MNQKHWGIGTTLAAICLLAGNGYFAKGLVTDALTITWGRSVIAALGLLLLMLMLRQSLALKTRGHYGMTVLAGVLLGSHWITYFHSMSISTVTLGMTTLYTYPMFTLWLQALFFRKKIPVGDWLATVLIIAGVWLMAAPDPGNASNNLEGALLGLFSALCFAARNLLQQHQLSDYPAHKTIFYQVVTISVLTPIMFQDFLLSTQTLELAALEWPLWILLGLLFTAVPHSLMAHGIGALGARSVSIIGCLQPVIGSVIAYVMLSEVASLRVILGAALVMIVASLEIYQQGKSPIAEAQESPGRFKHD